MNWAHQSPRGTGIKPKRNPDLCALADLEKNVRAALLVIARTGNNPNTH